MFPIRDVTERGVRNVVSETLRSVTLSDLNVGNSRSHRNKRADLPVADAVTCHAIRRGQYEFQIRASTIG